MPAKVIARSVSAFRQTPTGQAFVQKQRVSERVHLLTASEDIHLFAANHSTFAPYYNCANALGFPIYAIHNDAVLHNGRFGDVHFFALRPDFGEQIKINMSDLTKGFSPEKCCKLAQGTKDTVDGKPSLHFLPLVNSFSEERAKMAAAAYFCQETRLPPDLAKTFLTVPWMPFFARLITKNPAHHITRHQPLSHFIDVHRLRITHRSCPDHVLECVLADGTDYSFGYQGRKSRIQGVLPPSTEEFLDCAFDPFKRSVREGAETVRVAGFSVAKEQGWALDIIHDVRTFAARRGLATRVVAQDLPFDRDRVQIECFEPDGASRIGFVYNKGHGSPELLTDAIQRGAIDLSVLTYAARVQASMSADRHPRPQTITSFG